MCLCVYRPKQHGKYVGDSKLVILTSNTLDILVFHLPPRTLSTMPMAPKTNKRATMAQQWKLHAQTSIIK